MRLAFRKLLSAFAAMVLSVLALRHMHSDVFFFTFIAAMILAIMYWLDVGAELRAAEDPSPALRILGILLGVPQALLGFTCLIAGTAVVLWVLYNLVVERQPGFPSLILGFGVGPSLITFGFGWLIYAFRRQPLPPSESRDA
ncbi:hypothetical protein LU699_15125 [Luteimonas fraxinea]|uniref:Uncharacterized protein n=1 Tax=Luteimonas fraxinea TaxID=2901869 RepID=A0ABS8UEE1_9GAMM|nr:hypothetical protein [Luteimonas fraxinea]MCD9097111.1 hypothetical protein [Luteimonas fraxinea]MCD9126625.1 hypothetical protein [Luteimonas fraxinea]UHH09589.1 hypothetical protein LU699_15125 [Luteimonas fraxinea]